MARAGATLARCACCSSPYTSASSLRSGCPTGLVAISAMLAAPLFWTGLAMMASGLALGFWSIRVLARFFTVDVNIRETTS